jgi:hypothetical protein
VEGKPFTLTIFWTGTPTGPITVEFSSDHDPSNQASPHNGHWDSVNSQLVPVPTAPAGAGGQYTISPEPLRTLYFRVTFAPSAGTGAITCLWNVES